MGIHQRDYFSPTPRTAAAPPRATAQIVRLPIFRDGVFVGNEFIRISPRLRTRIREMAEAMR